MIPELEVIKPTPDRHIQFIDGEWVITEHGKIIARNLYLSQDDAERLVIAVKAAVSRGEP